MLAGNQKMDGAAIRETPTPGCGVGWRVEVLQQYRRPLADFWCWRQPCKAFSCKRLRRKAKGRRWSVKIGKMVAKSLGRIRRIGGFCKNGMMSRAPRLSKSKREIGTHPWRYAHFVLLNIRAYSRTKARVQGNSLYPTLRALSIATRNARGETNPLRHIREGGAFSGTLISANCT